MTNNNIISALASELAAGRLSVEAFTIAVNAIQQSAPAEAPAPAPAPVEEPAPKAREYKAPVDFTGTWVQEGAYVKPATADGKYVGPFSIRKTLNKRLTDAGARYDKDARAYRFDDANAALLFVQSTPATVSAAEQQAYRDARAERAERKAAKAAAKA